MCSPSVLTKSVLCCLWLAGFVLIDSAAGGAVTDNPQDASSDAPRVVPPIISGPTEVAKTPNRPGAPAFATSLNPGGISLANHYRRRIVQSSVSSPRPQPPAAPPVSETPPAVPPQIVPPEVGSPVAAGDDLFPPLSAVSLSSATRAESLRGDVLPLPDDLATDFQTPYGRFLDVSGYRRAPAPTLTPFAFCHHPLYFEDPNLERCGIHHGCLTDAVSAVRFFGRVPLTPYMVGSQPPRSCVPSLGPCRYCHEFGHDAYLPRPNPEGAAWQAALTVGFVFLIP
ncbi:MAG: hypothetical protein NXI04_18280 [Planctomycetaceae bacterium]|nr:hypothetical protein [Planctomycetaceae bacterium]